jgi:uncharacterized coiled-coil protein SlyX
MADDDLTARRVLRLEERLDQLEERIATTPVLALDAIAAMRADTAARFEGLEGRFNRLEQRVDQRFDRLEARLGAMEQILSSIAEKLGARR